MANRLNSGRMAAALALIAVEEGVHAQEALARAVSGQDENALAWFIAMGVLRHRASIDAALRVHLRKPIHSLDREVRVVLRMGVVLALRFGCPRRRGC